MADTTDHGSAIVCLEHNVAYNLNEGVWFKHFDLVNELLDARTSGLIVLCPLCETEE